MNTNMSTDYAHVSFIFSSALQDLVCLADVCMMLYPDSKARFPACTVPPDDAVKCAHTRCHPAGI